MTNAPGNAAATATTCNRLGFLHGDLGLATKAVAAIFGVQETDVAETCKQLSIKWSHVCFGQLTRASFPSLANVMGFDPGELGTVEQRDEWQTMKATLGREFVRLAAEGTIRWAELDVFLERLPAVQAEAESRVTALRLEFLYGDLGAQISEIMTILGAPERFVRRGLVQHGIERHRQYHPELDERALDELARRLGVEEWPKDWFARSRFDRHGATVKREVREGLIDLTRNGRLDFAVLDTFTVNIRVARTRCQRPVSTDRSTSQMARCSCTTLGDPIPSATPVAESGSIPDGITRATPVARLLTPTARLGLVGATPIGTTSASPSSLPCARPPVTWYVRT